MNPLISIIVPVYNARNTIERCINSVLSQTYSQFELIIIDDGSTDDSLAICEKFALSDSRIIVKHQDNKGVSAARNLGISLCKGEWISFLDSDDYLGEHFLQDLIVNTTDCDIIIGGLQKIYILENQELPDNRYPNAYIHDGFTDYISIWDKVLIYGYACGRLYKSTIIKTHHITFPIEYSLHEDHIFYYKFLTHSNIIKLSDKNGYYYVNNGVATLSRNTSVNPDLKWNAYQQISDILKEIIAKFKLTNDSLPLTQNFIIRLYISAVINSYRRKMYNSKYIFPNNDLRNQIRKFHKPLSIKGYAIKYILGYLPNGMQHLILKLLIR